MSIFFKKKRGNLEENGFSSKQVNHFREFIENRKQKIAGWLSRKINRCSPLKKKVGLILFCVLFGGMCFYILTGCIRNRDPKSHILVINPMHSGVPVKHPPLITDSMYRHAERAKKWLDSLAHADTMKFKVILLSRPYLLTNLQLIEHIYESQKR